MNDINQLLYGGDTGKPTIGLATLLTGEEWAALSAEVDEDGAE